MRAVCYSRVANPRTDDSHALQGTRCVITAALHSVKVEASYQDTGMSRGEFLRLLDDLRAGSFDVVVVDRTCRLPLPDAVERIVMAGGRLVSEDGVDTDVRARSRWDEQVRRMADEAGTLPL